VTLSNSKNSFAGAPAPTPPCRIAFVNQGCRLNQAETAAVESAFWKESGYDIVAATDPADVVIVNTCTVTENSDTDTRKLLSKLGRLNPDVKVALMGCQAQIFKEKLLEMPHVQWVIGNADKMGIKAFIEAEGTLTHVPKLTRKPFTVELTAMDRGHTRANLKIQDGCDFYCSFCIIPFARGPARSRVFDDLMREAKILVDSGFQELIVTGINVGTYSHDGKNIVDVIDALAQLPGLTRIRVSSIEPTTIPMDLIARMADPTHPLCPYLHIPIQSGSETILRRMQRKYTLTEFVKFINDVIAVVPNISIGTDVIVGFPGETDELFEETRALLAALPFSYFHVFSYSERSLARSQKLDGQVSHADIHHRSEVLRELSQVKKKAYARQFIDTTQAVLFEKPKRGTSQGLTPNYVRVKLSNPGNTHPSPNTVQEVRVTGIEGDVLVGNLLSYKENE
jgi:threonylcarbamoyladenosine tRNA methylthiotransferase MtaB